MKKSFRYDYELGPLHESPYAGGTAFPVFETLTVKPGFKIWVDGGTIDYPQNLCLAKRLDCSATCCKQSYCAAHRRDCFIYERRSFKEIYIGMLVMTMISFGIPTCFLSAEVILNFKMFRVYNEDADAYVGGYTMLEMVTYCFTCGKSAMIHEGEKDEYEYDFLNEPELDDLPFGYQIDAKTNLTIAPLPSTSLGVN